MDASSLQRGPTVALFGARWLCVVVAGGLVVGHLAAVGLAFLFLVWLFTPVLFMLIFAALAAASVTAWVILKGRWSKGIVGAVQVVAGTLLAAAYVVIAAHAVLTGFDSVASRSTFGTLATDDASSSFVTAAAAVLAIAALIATVPLPVRRRVAMLGALAAGFVATGAVGTALAVAVNVDSCQDFKFEPDRWQAALRAGDHPGERSDAERIARAIARCATVRGASRRRVRRFLGGAPTPTAKPHGSGHWA